MWRFFCELPSTGIVIKNAVLSRESGKKIHPRNATCESVQLCFFYEFRRKFRWPRFGEWNARELKKGAPCVGSFLLCFNLFLQVSVPWRYRKHNLFRSYDMPRNGVLVAFGRFRKKYKTIFLEAKLEKSNYMVDRFGLGESIILVINDTLYNANNSPRWLIHPQLHRNYIFTQNSSHCSPY